MQNTQTFTHILATSDEHELDLLVKSGADLDDRYKAWDLDANEYLWINGWMFSTEVIANNVIKGEYAFNV